MGIFFRAEEREWSTRDVAHLLRSHAAFASLSHGEGLKLAEHMTAMRLKAGTVLFHEGQQSARFMALILEGEATAEAVGGGHAEPLMLKVLQEGDLIGEQGILDTGARSATVTADTDMGLATMSQAQFNKLAKAHPAVGCKILVSILQTVSIRLRDANKRLQMLSQLNRTMNEELDDRSTPNLVADEGDDEVHSIPFRQPDGADTLPPGMDTVQMPRKRVVAKRLPPGEDTVPFPD
jgi:CRP/FNR family cyclic AMP-dependent transcriptional regulator